MALRLCSMSCKLIDEFRSNFVNALILTKPKSEPLHIIFHYFLTGLWPLIGVKGLFPINNILRTNRVS